MKPLVSVNRELGCREFQGTDYQGEIVKLACVNYGYLIKSVARSEISFDEFADKIEKNYDVATCKQTEEVVRVLREVQKQWH